MDSGMMWFDNNSNISLASKLKEAAIYYCKRYGCIPNACYLHPSMLNGEPDELDGMRLFSSATIIPYHFWIGVEDHKTLLPLNKTRSKVHTE